MKKYLAILLMMSLAAAPAALAEDPATILPCGVTFEMAGPALEQAVEGKAVFTPYSEESDPEIGAVTLHNVRLGIGNVTATLMSLEVQRNNSGRRPCLSLILAELDTGGDVVAAFRAALSEFTAVYGEPDNNPFDEASVQLYVEYGTLDAFWTKPDVRINLTMGRMHEDSLSVSFSPRICFDESDLDA